MHFFISIPIVVDHSGSPIVLIKLGYLDLTVSVRPWNLSSSKVSLRHQLKFKRPLKFPARTSLRRETVTSPRATSPREVSRLSEGRERAFKRTLPSVSETRTEYGGGRERGAAMADSRGRRALPGVVVDVGRRRRGAAAPRCGPNGVASSFRVCRRRVHGSVARGQDARARAPRARER